VSHFVIKLKRVDEAKQWAIGDWLVDGKRHYGDGLYGEASKILGIGEHELSRQKRMSQFFEFGVRTPKLSWRHHYEITLRNVNLSWQRYLKKLTYGSEKGTVGLYQKP